MMRMLRSSEGIAIVRGVAVEAIARGVCCRAGVGQVTGGWFGPGRDDSPTGLLEPFREPRPTSSTNHLTRPPVKVSMCSGQHISQAIEAVSRKARQLPYETARWSLSGRVLRSEPAGPASERGNEAFLLFEWRPMLTRLGTGPRSPQAL
jgi:hypothetical protein